MKYAKPEIIVLGKTSILIERNSQAKKIGTPVELPGDPDNYHNPPAYDLDE